jgi:hypothetical protein
MFTLKGYTKIFETCENNSDVFTLLAGKIDDLDVDIWKNELFSKNMWPRVKNLFSYWTQHCENDKLLNKDDYIKFIQIFSLLENVFRNTLVRPYIPAYRTINMDCGRYHSFVTKCEEHLFQSLSFFKDISQNRLIYQEQDPIQTIIYAITCSVFWHVLSMKLRDKYPTTT